MCRIDVAQSMPTRKRNGIDPEGISDPWAYPWQIPAALTQKAPIKGDGLHAIPMATPSRIIEARIPCSIIN